MTAQTAGATTYTKKKAPRIINSEIAHTYKQLSSQITKEI